MFSILCFNTSRKVKTQLKGVKNFVQHVEKVLPLMKVSGVVCEVGCWGSLAGRRAAVGAPGEAERGPSGDSDCEQRRFYQRCPNQQLGGNWETCPLVYRKNSVGFLANPT